ncbi:MAG TPA: ATP-binding protein [Chloroflexia bacterium]|nr:ATP-binding protein [Chloroflexia bacterium]
MRIRYKILLGYSALITVLVVLIAFFLLTLSDVNHRYNDLINRDQRVLLQANNIRSSVQRQIAAASTYQQIGDSSLLVEYNEAVRQQQQSLEEIMPLLTQESDRATILDIKQGSIVYSKLAREAMDLSRSPDADATVLTLKRVQSETARLSLLNALESFIANKNSQVTAGQAELGAKVEETSAQLLIWSLVGVIGAAIAGTLLTEGFTAPLRRLMRNIQGISAGDLRTAVAVHSKDEIGELAAVLETMRQRLAAALEEKETLLEAAKQEADTLAETRRELEVANSELQEALDIESDARKRIEEIDRLKTEFASMVSHELKTPVSYVYNYAGALKEHNNSLNDGQRIEFLTAIQGEAQHLITLIDDIMAISLLETVGLTHRFVETDLRKLTDSVVKDQQLTTRRHTISVKGPESLAVRADPTRLRQVLNNLISNAIKYSPQGDVIEVRLRANPTDGMALIYVRDHGIGVTPEDVPKLFDRFSRVQRKETMAIPGSGLGLYIAHHIVEAHGGKLSLQPAPGKGTIAEVTVPLMPERNSGPLSDDGLGMEIIQVEPLVDGTVPNKIISPDEPPGELATVESGGPGRSTNQAREEELVK